MYDEIGGRRGFSAADWSAGVSGEGCVGAVSDGSSGSPTSISSPFQGSEGGSAPFLDLRYVQPLGARSTLVKGREQDRSSGTDNGVAQRSWADKLEPGQSRDARGWGSPRAYQDSGPNLQVSLPSSGELGSGFMLRRLAPDLFSHTPFKVVMDYSDPLHQFDEAAPW